MLGAGRRIDRVEFQAPTAGAGKDAFGQREDSGWTTYASRWAEVVALSGRELESARQMIATATHRITVVATELTGVVLPTHRVLVEGTVMEIGSALPKGGLREELVILATQRF